MAVAQAPWQVRAEARYVRRSPRKVKLVVDEIRGLSVPVARTVLAFMTQAGAKDVEKVLSSAAANAEANYGLTSDELVVAEAHVGQGPTLKRYRPRARGRVGRIRKPTCHIFIGLSEPPELWDESSELVPILPPDADVVDAAVGDVEEAAPDVEADGAEDDTGEPYEGYAGSTAKEVVARLPELDDAALARVAAADTRTTVQAQIGVERRKRGLEEPAQAGDGAGTAAEADRTAAEPPADQDAPAGSLAEESGGSDEAPAAENDAGEPYEGYAGSTAKEVVARLPELDDAALARVAAADTRTTVQAQIGVERRKRGLEEPAQAGDGAGTAAEADRTAAEPPADQDAPAGSLAEESGGSDEATEAAAVAEPPEAADEDEAGRPDDEEKGS